MLLMASVSTYLQRYRREYSKTKLRAGHTTTLNLCANVTTRFDHRQV